MKFRNLSIKYSMMIVLVAIITPLYFLFAMINYNSIRNGILNNTQLAINQTRINIIDTIISTEKSYELVSTYYDEMMAESLQLFNAEYETQKGNVSAIDLDAIKARYHNNLDLYIIDENGVIIRTTFPSALGIDFKTVPDFFKTLTELRQRHDPEISHVTTDLVTGELRKWGYIPTADHRYVLEVGISPGSLSQFITQLNYTDMEKTVQDNNPFIADITVYDKNHIMLGSGQTETDPARIAMIDTVISNGTDQIITGDLGLLDQEYIYVNTFPGGMNDSQKVIAIRYQYDDIIRQINGTRMATLLVFLTYTVFSLLLIYFLVTRSITEPLIRLTNRIKGVSGTNLDFFMPVSGSNELGQLTQSFNELSAKLQSTLVTKTYLENVIDSVGDILIIMDSDLKILRINQYTRLFLSKHCGQIVGSPIDTIFDGSSSLRDLQAKLILNPRLENIEGTMIKDNHQKTTVIASISAYRSEDGQILGYILNAKDISKTKQILKKLEESNLFLKKQESILLTQSTIDALTGACNRGCIFNILEDIHANTPLLYSTFSVIMIDLDHFKSVNDRFGHQAGDTVLVETVQIIMDNLRKSDFLGRYGGEEFLIVMPDTTLNEGYQIAQRIRIKIKDTRFYHDRIELTISGGIAEWDHNSVSELIETADRLLYQAKKQGRNTILRTEKS
ncbi:sensor domain-containing diguanylate cyclase [Acetobacterium wieringae]|uniref:Putative diguanylate cyclase YedQ n=1 Tax=Acetobacterium wieringae TaxID=52694 RepID=A0A1F2PLZ2_9FIRM|nr:diguanylate cyclase [Acetobacterium wieringae]OFV71975.1 putative diguanylate cyclase YedQ [Acetobacterium wieringae]